MNIAEYAIEKKVVMYILMAVLLVGGLIGFRNSGRLEDPEFTIREVKVITRYPGATPDEVEEEVSDLVESAAQKLSQVEWVESKSSNGVSEVTVTFFQGISTEAYRQIYDELRRKITDIQPQLPPGAGQSIVNDDFGDVYGILYAVTGEGYTDKELYDFSEDLQKRLLLVRGVAKVELWGTPNEVVYVEIPRSRMVDMQLSQDTLISIIQQQNMVVDAGNVVVGSERPLFRVTGDFDTVEAIGNLRIPSPENMGLSQVKLSDIATITRDYEEPRTQLMRFDGRPAIGVAVSAITTENVVEVGDRLDDAIFETLEMTPIGIEIETVFNQPDAVTAAVNNFVMSLFQSVAIVVGLLVIFMGVQSGVIIGFMLVLIISGTLLFMYVMDITLQRISLGALIIAMGMLVDNSIVITEGILVRMQKGEDKKEAAKAVVDQTMWPLFGATVVAIFAFAAVGMSPDATGEYTRTLFQVIIISLLLSWFLAITVNPLICVQFMSPKKPGEKKVRFKRINKAVTATKEKIASIKLEKEGGESDGGGFMAWFRNVLAGAMRRRWTTMGVLAVLLVTAVIGFGFVTQAFFPSSGQPQFMVDYFLPEGSDISATEADIIEIENYLMDEEIFPEIRQISAFIGASPPRFQLTFAPESPNSRLGQLMVEVHDPATINDVLGRIQTYLNENYPGGTSQAYRFQLGPGAKGLVNARIQGPDPDVLRALSAQVKQIYFRTGNAVAIRDDWGERAKVIRANVDERAAREVGITRPQINQALQASFEGLTVGLYRENHRLIPIISRPPFGERADSTALYDLYVWSPVLQTQVPLSSLVKSFTLGWEDTRVLRRDRQRTMEITCDPMSGEASVLFEQIRPQVEALDFPPGYTLTWGGQYEDSARANAGISQTFPLAFLAMLLTIFVLWNKVRQPIIIFLSVPLSLIGIVAGLLITGFPFSFMGLMGMLALFGMVIKNAIVMVDEIDLTLAGGAEPWQGIIEASSSRVRPVMMAALSTVLGMSPLLPDLFFQGMAISVMAGLTVASVITLVVTPVLYAIFFKVKESGDPDAADGKQPPPETT